MKRLHETPPMLASLIERSGGALHLYSANDAINAARHMAAMRGESIAIVERAFLLDGPHPYTGHDAVGYGMALSTWVAPQHIITWVHPHGTMQISDERMTGLYARDLADRLTDQAVRA